MSLPSGHPRFPVSRYRTASVSRDHPDLATPVTPQVRYVPIRSDRQARGRWVTHDIRTWGVGVRGPESRPDRRGEESLPTQASTVAMSDSAGLHIILYNPPLSPPLPSPLSSSFPPNSPMRGPASARSNTAGLALMVPPRVGVKKRGSAHDVSMSQPKGLSG